MKKVVVLGVGQVGRAIAMDLSKVYAVTAVDVDPNRLKHLKSHSTISVVQSDLSKSKNIVKCIIEADLVISAVPGFMGFETLERVISCGKNVVDIAFFSEDPFDLDAKAKAQGVTAVVDCGVAPGMSNIILGHHSQKMDVESYVCFVGGLPFKRSWPYQYKAPFSPIDVMEEYTRPARIKKEGKLITEPALSESEFVEFERIGTLEAFLTDGLRTLLKTLPIPNMVEKTLRYPGHVEIMRILRESGFLNKKPISVGNVSVSPLDVTATLLFPQWQFAPDEPDFTVMRIMISGKINGLQKKVVYHLFDQFNPETGLSSMARTTGYTSTAVARLILHGNFIREGICPPEYVGMETSCFEKILNTLKQKNVCYQMKEFS